MTIINQIAEIEEIINTTQEKVVALRARAVNQLGRANEEYGALCLLDLACKSLKQANNAARYARNLLSGEREE